MPLSRYKKLETCLSVGFYVLLPREYDCPERIKVIENEL